MPKELAGRSVYSVSEIVAILASELEMAFPDVWVEGEVSGFRRAASGHCYFTLKDARAALKTVLFRTHALRVPFQIENGMAVLVRGKLSLYEASGDLQLYATATEPAGLGALQMAFEQAKRRLVEEGLTDPARKRPVPPFPRRVGVVTSLEGAALRDVLSVLRRRKARFDVVVSPALVQGASAPASLRSALRRLRRVPGIDVVLLTRGGGSMEDLWGFNDEALARDVAAYPVPVISAVGHEVDSVLTDFTADLRAPTPSVAAELLTQQGALVEASARDAARRLRHLAASRLLRARERLERSGAERLGLLILRRVEELQQRCDRATEAASAAQAGRSSRLKARLDLCTRALSPEGLNRWLQALHARLASASSALRERMGGRLRAREQGLGALVRLLHSISPLQTLARGYAAAFTPSGRPVTSARLLVPGDLLSLAFSDGGADVTVTSTTPSHLPPALRASEQVGNEEEGEET
jgi:exodeoxyribonuclease VII large subunit